MNNTSKEFLTKLADLLEEYNVTMEITESCHGYQGFSVDGLEFEIPYTEDEYKLYDYVELSGSHHTAKDILDEVNK